MIQEQNLAEIGKILKPHGVKGEMTVLFNQPEFADEDNLFYFFLLDGMYIPFFVEEFRYNSNVSARIKFEGINSIEHALTFGDTFISKELVKEAEEEFYLESEWDMFIGFSVFDENSTFIGEINGVDSSTLNVLFIVINGDQEFLIPATLDFILKMDPDKKEIHLKLPEGLLDDSL